MENTTRSSFRFIKYLVEDSSVHIKNAPISEHMNLNLNMTANVNGNSPLCELTLGVDMQDDNANISFNVRLTGYFEALGADKATRDSFICRNAPAILFPYVRAYVSTLTAQAGIAPIIMPTVNLVKDGEELLKKLNKPN